MRQVAHINLHICVVFQIGPLRVWPGGLCLSRSIGDTDVGEFIVPVPHVKQIKVAIRHQPVTPILASKMPYYSSMARDTRSRSLQFLEV